MPVITTRSSPVAATANTRFSGHWLVLLLALALGLPSTLASTVESGTEAVESHLGCSAANPAFWLERHSSPTIVTSPIKVTDEIRSSSTKSPTLDDLAAVAANTATTKVIWSQGVQNNRFTNAKHSRNHCCLPPLRAPPTP